MRRHRVAGDAARGRAGRRARADRMDTRATRRPRRAGGAGAHLHRPGRSHGLPVVGGRRDVRRRVRRDARLLPGPDRSDGSGGAGPGAAGPLELRRLALGRRLRAPAPAGAVRAPDRADQGRPRERAAERARPRAGRRAARGRPARHVLRRPAGAPLRPTAAAGGGDGEPDAAVRPGFALGGQWRAVQLEGHLRLRDARPDGRRPSARHLLVGRPGRQPRADEVAHPARRQRRQRRLRRDPPHRGRGRPRDARRRRSALSRALPVRHHRPVRPGLGRSGHPHGRGRRGGAHALRRAARGHRVQRGRLLRGVRGPLQPRHSGGERRLRQRVGRPRGVHERDQRARPPRRGGSADGRGDGRRGRARRAGRVRRPGNVARPLPREHGALLRARLDGGRQGLARGPRRLAGEAGGRDQPLCRHTARRRRGSARRSDRRRRRAGS